MKKKARLISPGALVTANGRYSLYESTPRESEWFIMDKHCMLLVLSVHEDPMVKDEAGHLISVCFLTSSPALPIGWFYAYSSYFESYFSVLSPAP